MGIPQAWSEFRTIECYRCGTGFAVERGLYERRQNDHESFWCPNGHEQHFIGETPLQRELREAKARAELAEAKAQRHREAREWAEKQAKGANIAAGIAKGKLRRVHERVHAGVCPHCNRTFKQLAAHMATKHGDQK